MESLEMSPASAEQQNRKWKYLIEMEGYGRDGTEIIDSDLCREVIVEAPNAAAAEQIINIMDFGNLIVSYYDDPEELKLMQD